MNKFLKLPFYSAMVALMCAGMASCSDDDGLGNGDLTPRESALKVIVDEYTANTVIPTYTAMADASIKLHTAVMAMYNAGAGNVTTSQVTEAGKAWKEARKYWERSEAWLYGPAADFDVDPHIDSWPLDAQKLETDLLQKPDLMAQVDPEGVYISGQEYGLLGFHALEYMLFATQGSGMNQQSVAHDTDYTKEELSYLAGVAGDLRNHCIFLEAAWKGEKNISAEKQQVLAKVRTQVEEKEDKGYRFIKDMLNELANGLCYAEEMKNPGEGGGNKFTNYLEAAQTMITDGIQNIANEVGNIKIGNPTGHGSGDEFKPDPNYIESPYSLNSIEDFKGNIISIENAYRGFQSSKDYNAGEQFIKPVSNSLSTYVATLNADLDSRVIAAIDNAYACISKMKEPFIATCKDENGLGDINKAAITACQELNDIFDEVNAELAKQF